MSSNRAAGIDEFADRRADILSMFLKAQTERPDSMTDQKVLTRRFPWLLQDPKRLASASQLSFTIP